MGAVRVVFGASARSVAISRCSMCRRISQDSDLRNARCWGSTVRGVSCTAPAMLCVEEVWRKDLLVWVKCSCYAMTRLLANLRVRPTV